MIIQESKSFTKINQFLFSPSFVLFQRPSMGTGDDGQSGKHVTSHVVTASKKEGEHAVTRRQDIAGKHVPARTHSIECVT